MAHQFTTSYLDDSLSLFRHYKKLAEGAMAQVSDEHLASVLDSEMNSISQIVKHMAGNMHSRWTNFLSSDGEKPDRNRDTEFTAPPKTRKEMMELWESGWNTLFSAFEELSDLDLSRTVAIRGERHSVIQAVNRQLAHYSYHCGQIILLAKHFQAGNWRTLSVARGESEMFNQKVRTGEASQR